jgi:hypothetical protein
MADEQESIAPTPAPSEAAPPPIAPEPGEADEPRKIEDDLSGEPETEAAEEGEAGEEQASTEEELEEFEWNTRKIKASKGVKQDLDSMKADYTRGKQEVAARRKELEAHETRVREQAKASEQDLTERALFIGKAQELERYKNVDWDAYIQQDPVAAQQAFTRQQQLKDELQGLSQTIQQRQSQRSSEAQQDRAKRLNETLEFAKKEIKGWSPDLDAKIGEFARAQGIPDADLQAAMNPQVYKILHLAFLGSQALNKPAVPKLVPPSPMPLQTVAAKGSAPVRKSLADMSMEEYAAFRSKQIAAKRG